jgi:hypothetical protein
MRSVLVGTAPPLAAIGAQLARPWTDRFAPWLLGPCAIKETQAVSQGATYGQIIRSALRSCLQSTNEAMRESWYHALPFKSGAD